MSHKNEFDQVVQSQVPKRKHNVRYRRFLKATLMIAVFAWGAMAMLITSITQSSTQTVQAATNVRVDIKAVHRVFDAESSSQLAVQVAPNKPYTINVDASETWTEPGVFTDTQQTLILTATETPSGATGFFGWHSNVAGYTNPVPGPTVIITGDAVLKVTLFNELSGNDGTYWALNHPSSRTFCTMVPRDKITGLTPIPVYPLPSGQAISVTGLITYPDMRPPNMRTPVLCGVNAGGAVTTTIKDWELPLHVNGPHQQHTTNLHTHGLHVAPGVNGNGTHSDNVLL